MTRYFTIILILGLAFSQEQEFLYSTLVDTSLEYDPFFWTSAVYKFDEQGLNIEQITSSSKIEDISENQSKIDYCNTQILKFIKEKDIEIVER